MQVAAMETDTDMVVKRLSVPMGLEELMESLTKEVLRRKPSDIYAFASEHFAQLLEIRDQGNYRGTLRRIGKSYSLASHNGDSRSSHVKIKSATFGTMTKTKKPHTRNKSPAPKSFLTKNNISKGDSNIVSKISNDKTSKVLTEKYQPSKKNLKDCKMKIEVNKQPIELESKKIIETQRKSDNARRSYEKRRSIVVQKRSNEKDATGKLRSRSSSVNIDGDISQNALEKVKRKSEKNPKKEERKKTKYATMLEDETADELKVSKIGLVTEKANSKATEKLIKEDAYNQSIPQASVPLSNIDISESVVTQMQKQHNEEDSFDTSDKDNSKNRKPFTSNFMENSSKDEIDNKGNDVLITVVSQKKLSEDEASTTENSKDNNENYQESYSEISNVDTEDTEKISEGKIELIISNIDNLSADDYKPGEVKEDKGNSDSELTDIRNTVEDTLEKNKIIDDAIYVIHGEEDNDTDTVSKNEILQKQLLQDMNSKDLEGKLKNNIDEVFVVKEDKESNKIDLDMIGNASFEESENIKLNQQVLNQIKAAITIQALVRGYLTRKVFNKDKVRCKENSTEKDVCNSILESVNEIVNKNLESKDNQAFPVALFNDKHEKTDLKQNFINEVNAALKIQAFVRKHLRRKAMNKELLNDLENGRIIDDSLPSILKSDNEIIESEIVDDHLVNYDSEGINKILSNTLHENIDLNHNLQNETEAVVKIQALVRGHLTRKMISEQKLLSIKEKTGNEIISDIPSKKNGNIDLEQSEVSTIEAVTKIQALIRGYLIRKGVKQAKLDKNVENSVSLQDNMNLIEHKKMQNDTINEEIETDFSVATNADLDMIKAATIIQAYVRGFLLRTNLRKKFKRILLPDKDHENHKQITFDFLEQEFINYDSNRYDNSRFDFENKSTNELRKIINESTYQDDRPNVKICQKQQPEDYIENEAKSIAHNIEKPFGDDVEPKINIIEKLAEITELQKPSECDELPHQRSSIKDAKKAATIIQALFRGYLTRKRYESFEQQLNKKKSFEEKLPTVLEVEDEESKEFTLSNNQVDEEQREKFDVKMSEDISAENFNPPLDEPIGMLVKRNETISDDEVLAMIKQLDDSPIPAEEPRRRSKTYTRSLTIDEPSIQHTNINLLTKSPTFIIGDEFQTFDRNESVDQSARTAEESLTSIESSDSNGMFEQRSDIKEITIAIKEGVQKLKETLENGIEINKLVDVNTMVDDGNIREITKAISEDVKELEKTLNEDNLSVTNSHSNNSVDSDKIHDFVDKNESYTRPVSKDSATSTDSVDTVIFNKMYKGETLELNTNAETDSDTNFEKKKDEITNELKTENLKQMLNSKQSEDSLQFDTVKQHSGILVNDILDTAAKKIQKFFKEVKNKNKSHSDDNQIENLKQTSSNLLHGKEHSTSPNKDEAAIIIQKNYKGYRVRRDLGKQKQEMVEDKQVIEQRADEEITKYLRQITEPIRRAFSADKGINEKETVDVRLKNRVRSADGGTPNIIYIPLRDYSDDDGEILKDIPEIHSPVHTQLYSKTPEEIIEKDNKLQAKPEICELDEESVGQECSEILSVSKEYQVNEGEREHDKKRESLTEEDGSNVFEDINDKKDKNINEKISTYIGTIIEPIKKAFQPDEDLEKNNLTIVVEPKPEYEYIPLKDYSENEKVDNITPLDGNITTNITNLDEELEGKNDSAVTAVKVNKVALNEIMNEYEKIENDAEKIEKKLPGTTDKNSITAEQRIDENDRKQFGENGSKQIEEYINSLIEPIKQTFSPFEKEKIIEFIPKKEELVYTYIPLRDYSTENSAEDSDITKISEKLKDEDKNTGKEEAKQDIDFTLLKSNFTEDVIKKENEGDLFKCKRGIDGKTEDALQKITADNIILLENASEPSVIFDEDLSSSASNKNLEKHIINKSDNLIQGQIDLDDQVEGITDDLCITTGNIELKDLNENHKDMDEQCLNVIESVSESIEQVVHRKEEIAQSMLGSGNTDNDQIADFTQELDKTVCITSPEVSVNVEQDSNANTVLLNTLSLGVDATGKLKEDEIPKTGDFNMSIPQESVDVSQEVKENLEINSVQSPSIGNENEVTEKDLGTENIQNLPEKNKGESEDSRGMLQGSMSQEDNLNLLEKEDLKKIEIPQTDDLNNDDILDLIEISKEKQSNLDSDTVPYKKLDVLKTHTEENLNDKSQTEHDNLASDSSIIEILQKDDLETDTTQTSTEIDQKTEADWKTDDISISMTSSSSSQPMDNVIKIEIKDKLRDSSIIHELPENVESLKILDDNLREENNKLYITEKDKLSEDQIPNKTENDVNKETENNLLTSLVSDDSTDTKQIANSELTEANTANIAKVSSDKDLRDDKSHASQNILKLTDESSSTFGRESDKVDEETINETKTQKLSQNYLNKDFEHTDEVETIADNKKNQSSGENLESDIYLENGKGEPLTKKENDAISIASEKGVGDKNLELDGESISSVTRHVKFSNQLNDIFNDKIENIEVSPAVDDNKHKHENKGSALANSNGDDELQARIKNIEFQIEDVLEKIGSTTANEALDKQSLNLQEHDEEKYASLQGDMIQNNMNGTEGLQKQSELNKNEDSKDSEENQLISNENTQQDNILELEKVIENTEDGIETVHKLKMELNNNAEAVTDLVPNLDANAKTEVDFQNYTSTIVSGISYSKLEKPPAVDEINRDFNNIHTGQLKSDTAETIIFNDKERTDAISNAENQDTIHKNEITADTLSKNIFNNHSFEANNVTNKLNIECNLNNRPLSGDDSSSEMCLEKHVKIDDTVNTCEKIVNDTTIDNNAKQKSVDEGDDQISKQNQDDSLVQKDMRSLENEHFRKETNLDVNLKQVHSIVGLEDVNEDKQSTEDFTYGYNSDEDKFLNKDFKKDTEEKVVQNSDSKNENIGRQYNKGLIEKGETEKETTKQQIERESKGFIDSIKLDNDVVDNGDSAKIIEKEHMVNLKDKNKILDNQHKESVEGTKKGNINEQAETKLENTENEYSQDQQNKPTDEEAQLNVMLSDEQESNNGKTLPFYLHQDTLYQNKSPIMQERKYSEALRLSTDSDLKNDTSETEERLLHSSEYHDSLPINISTNTTEKSLTTQTNGVQCNMEQERCMPTSTVLVHSGELHDSVLPVALQMNQDPAGTEIVTSTNKAQMSVGGDVAGAQASAKDDSERLGSTNTTRAQSEPSNITKMETEKRNNSTIVKKNMESEAATKIQASFRGYQVRKQLKNKLARDNITNIKRTTRRKSLGRVTETKSANKQATDLEQESATKIQAGIRGFLVRRRQKKGKTNSESV